MRILNYQLTHHRKMGNKMEQNKIYICNKDFPNLGLEVGDYFPTERFTAEAIKDAIKKGKIVEEDSTPPSPISSMTFNNCTAEIYDEAKAKEMGIKVTPKPVSSRLNEGWEDEFCVELPEMNSDWTDFAKKNIAPDRLEKQTIANEGWNNCRAVAKIVFARLLSSERERVVKLWSQYVDDTVADEHFNREWLKLHMKTFINTLTSSEDKK